MLMFPVYILDGETKLPKKGTYYVLARDGFYLAKDTGLIRAVVKVDKISILEEIKTSAELRLPKIPVSDFASVLFFLKTIFKRDKSEAVVLLYYSSDQRRFLTDVPFQEGYYGLVNYNDVQSKSKDGYQLVGTIHSHCDFGAFHSSIDIFDEQYFDGIHITIGHLNAYYFTLSCTIVVNNNRFSVQPQQVINGIKQIENNHTKKSNQNIGDKIVNRVFNMMTPRIDRNFASYQASYQGRHNFKSLYSEKQFFKLALSVEKIEEISFPKEWLSRVKKRILNYGQYIECPNDSAF